jgi:hypothetical protein
MSSILIRRFPQLLGHVQAPNHEFVDFEPPDAGATDREPADRESTDRQGANREGSKGQRADGLRPDGADCRKASKPRPARPAMGDVWVAFT